MNGDGRPRKLLDLELPIDATAPHAVRAAIDARVPADDPSRYELKLLVSELFSNSLRHADTEAPSVTGRIIVEQSDGGLRVFVANHGPDFDPAKYRPEGLGKALMDELAGGWGVEEHRMAVVWFDYPAQTTDTE